MLKEYNLQDLDFVKRYKHPALNWFKRRHLAKLDKKPFNVAQPPKDWNERLDMTKTTLKKTGVVVGTQATILTKKVGEGTVKAGIAIGNGAVNLKEKHKDKPWAQKLSNALGKIKSSNNRRPSMSEEAPPVSSESSTDNI